MTTPHSAALVDVTASPYAKLRPVGIPQAQLHGGYLGFYQAQSRRIALDAGYKRLEEAGNFHDLALAAGRVPGGAAAFKGPYYIDSDLYKWLEALAWELGREPSPQLQAMMDRTADLLAAAQAPDGYLNSYYQVTQPPEARWTNLRDHHELYCAGHLFQAAVAHARSTQGRDLLRVAVRFADLIDAVFGPGRREGACGHPEAEMALVELYRLTGEKRYLALSKAMIDCRGKGTMQSPRQDARYFQDRLPVRQATEVEGHAVRQLYLLCGMVDVYLETGEQALFDASLRMWDDLEYRKMYIIGGNGIHHRAESFGDAYELPNHKAYCETCATIATMMLGWRLLLATGQSRFADVIERALYNGVLSGVGRDFASWFYDNRLAGNGGIHRTPWYRTACCPPNVMRTLATLEQLIATTDDRGVQVHQYTASRIAAQTGSAGRLTLDVRTEYPWSGLVRFEVLESDGHDLSLSLRQPGWCERITIKVNGQAQKVDRDADGYLTLERRWQRGDVVELDLTMPAMLVEAHPRIESTAGCLAVQRGPVVYCFEQCDQPEGDRVDAARIDPAQPLRIVQKSQIFDGVPFVEAQGVVVDLERWKSTLYKPHGKDQAWRPAKLTAVPYHLWANRPMPPEKPGPMRVWLPKI